MRDHPPLPDVSTLLGELSGALSRVEARIASFDGSTNPKAVAALVAALVAVKGAERRLSSKRSFVADAEERRSELDLARVTSRD